MSAAWAAPASIMARPALRASDRSRVVGLDDFSRDGGSVLKLAPVEVCFHGRESQHLHQLGLRRNAQLPFHGQLASTQHQRLEVLYNPLFRRGVTTRSWLTDEQLPCLVVVQRRLVQEEREAVQVVQATATHRKRQRDQCRQ